MNSKTKNTFELEFCLSKEVFIKAYDENDSLWNKLHQDNIKAFHLLFKSEEDKQCIIDDINAINMVFFKTREEFLNGFNREECSDEEYDFLKYFIIDSQPYLSE